MTPQQITLIRDSWTQVKPIADTAAQLFYGKLFELDPKLKPMFSSDMETQGKKLMKVLTIAVNSLDRMESIEATVRDLGKRHVGYGVKAHHYDTVATALLWTLQQGLGEKFTDDVKRAWVEMYTTIASTMLEGAASASDDRSANESPANWRTGGSVQRLKEWVSGNTSVIGQN